MGSPKNKVFSFKAFHNIVISQRYANRKLDKECLGIGDQLQKGAEDPGFLLLLLYNRRTAFLDGVERVLRYERLIDKYFKRYKRVHWLRSQGVFIQEDWATTKCFRIPTLNDEGILICPHDRRGHVIGTNCKICTGLRI